MSSLNRVSEDIQDLLTGPYAISYTAFLISRFSIFQSIATEEALGQSLQTAIAYTVLGDLIRLLGIYVADKTALKHRRVLRVKLSTALSTVLLINFIASLIPAIIILVADQELRSFFIRINSTTSFTFAGMTFANLIVAIVAQQRQNISLLRSRNSSISLMEQEAENKLLLDQQNRERLAKSKVNFELAKLREKINLLDIESSKSDIKALVGLIETYGERTVRAYSHNVLKELTSERKFRARGEAINTLGYFFKINNLNFAPLPTLIVIFFVSGVSQATRNGLKGLTMTMMIVAVLTPILFLSKYIIGNFVSVKTTYRIISCLIGLTFIFYATLGMASIAFSRMDMDVPYKPSFTAFIITIAVFLITVVSSLYLQQIMLIDDLTIKLNKKEQLVAHLNVENAVKEIELAQLLHGPVQGKLSSIVMSLGLYLNDSSSRNAVQDGKWLQMAQGSLDEVSNMINSSLPNSTEALDFQSHLSQMKVQYDMLLNISESITMEARQRISKSQRLQRFVIDVLANAITNALRHGAARNLDILIELSEDNTLVMQIADDGCGPSDRIIPGIGLNQIRAQNGRWLLEKSRQGGALLKVELELEDAR